MDDFSKLYSFEFTKWDADYHNQGATNMLLQHYYYYFNAHNEYLFNLHFNCDTRELETRKYLLQIKSMEFPTFIGFAIKLLQSLMIN